MKNIYTSIDIGSDTIKITVCELFKNKLNLLATTSVKSKGIKKGLIYNIEDAKETVQKAIDEIEQMLGIKIKKVIATIPSYYADFKMVKGETKIDNEELVVTSNELKKVIKEAVKNKTEINQELITTLPIDFSVDENETKSPIGLEGETLSMRAIMVATPKKNIYSVINLLESINIEVIDILIGSIADINAFRTKEVDEKIGALINIGSDKTTISVYNKGIVVKESVLGFGGTNVDSDIAYMYKTDNVEAKKIKEKFVLAYKKNASVNDTYEIINKEGEYVKINQFEVSEVAMLRIEDILQKAKREINVLTNKTIEYTIVTGGLTNMEDFDYIAEDVFGKDVIMGNVKLVGLRNNRYVTAIGSIIYFISKLKLQNTNYTMVNKNDIEELSSVKRNVINVSNDSMLGKVFGYFLGE